MRLNWSATPPSPRRHRPLPPDPRRSTPLSTKHLRSPHLMTTEAPTRDTPTRETLPQTMTAAVMHAPGDIRVEQVAVPRPGPGQVLLKIAACGVCGSDIPRMLRNGGYIMPIICGHEFSGWVVELGDGVSGFDIGELVSVPPLIPCRTCDYCLKGAFGLCENYDYFGSRCDGAYAQYTVSPVGNLLKMP